MYFDCPIVKIRRKFATIVVHKDNIVKKKKNKNVYWSDIEESVFVILPQQSEIHF